MKKSKRVNKHVYTDQLNKVFKWYIRGHVDSDHQTSIRDIGFQFKDHVNLRAKHRGTRDALSYVKAFRLACLRGLSGAPLSKKDRIGISLLSTGLPRDIPQFAELWSLRDPILLRHLLTILTISRYVKLAPILDLKSITDTWEGKIPLKWKTFQSAIRDSLGLEERDDVQGKKCHLSTKSGPNGQALLGSMGDAARLIECEQLFNNLKAFGGEAISQILDKMTTKIGELPFAEYYNALDIFPREHHPFMLVRKLSAFGDYEGKTRQIAIADYWTQSILKPLHQRLMKHLSQLKEDCTFDQTSFKDKLPSEGPFYCFDLTNATDRLPITFQVEVISLVIGRVKALQGAEILTSEGFTHRMDRKGAVFYATGQPMGCYSSWPAMALTHHVIVGLAAFQCDVNAEGKYVVLGDDLVIADPSIAAEYRSIMKELDVPISEQKTYQSKDFYEFAKRYVYQGVEITPYPIPAIRETGKRYYLLQNTIQTAESRGYILPLDKTYDSILDLGKRMGKGEQAPRTLKLYKVFDSLVSKRYDEANRYIALEQALRQNGQVHPNKDALLTSENLKGLLPMIVESMLKGDIGQIAKDCTNIQISLEQRINAKSGNLSKASMVILREIHPLWHIARDLNTYRERYLKLIAKAFGSDFDMDRMWETLRFIATELPRISTKIMNARSVHRILGTQSRLVKLLIKVVTDPA